MPSTTITRINRLLNKISLQTLKRHLAKNSVRKISRFTLGQTSRLLPKPIHFVDSASCISAFESIFEQEIYKFPCETGTPFVIDCGANIGLATIYWKLLYPDAKILAFEPDTQLCEIFEMNCRSFGLAQIELIRKAVWHSDGTVNFKGDHADGGSLTINVGENTVEVPTARLKSYLEERSIDLLKIDIEGAEIEVLNDCANSLSGVKRIFVEYHSFCGQKQRLDELVSVLIQAGFRIHIQPEMDSRQPFVRLRESNGMDNRLNIFGIR